MPKEVREVVADWLMLFAAIALLVALFLPWSHQFSPSFLAEWAPTGALRGLPRDPTAWQVYSTADVGLAVLAAGLVAVALFGRRIRRLLVLAAAAVALAFTVHAQADPPNNGALLRTSAVRDVPQAASGETVAIAALAVAIGALVLSFTAD